MIATRSEGAAVELLPAALVRSRREKQSLGDGDDALEDLLSLVYGAGGKTSQMRAQAVPGPARCWAKVASKWARSSAIESPPSFSSSASASTSATIASAMTPAAGRAVTSLRSYWDGWASRVSRSALGSPCRQVAIGFL